MLIYWDFQVFCSQLVWNSRESCHVRFAPVHVLWDRPQTAMSALPVMDMEIKGMHFYMSVMANARNVWSCGKHDIQRVDIERQVFSKSDVPAEAALNRTPCRSDPNSLPRRRLCAARCPRGGGQGACRELREPATVGPECGVFLPGPDVHSGVPAAPMPVTGTPGRSRISAGTIAPRKTENLET